MSTAEVRLGDDSPAPPSVIPLALLDGYKVKWSRETVARDIVQNFFDEVDDFREVAVEVDAARGAIEVRGPSRFDLEYLRYIGATTKVTRRTAGGFGEGFKVCALVLLRDFRCAVTAGSRRWEIKPFLRPMKLGNELCYEVRTLPAGDELAGSFVRIEQADARLCQTFASAKELFRHPDNPRLASPVFVDEASGIGVFEARDDDVGELYYRRQHRGHLRFRLGGALSFAFDDRLDALEGDRDRRDLALAAPLVAAVAARLPSPALEELVFRLRAYWQRGGKVLAALLGEAKRRGLRFSFPRRWLARADGGFFIEKHAERVGFHLGVHKLAAVGMPSVQDRFGAAREPRPPTAVEAARMAVTRDLYRHLSGEEPLFPRFRVVDVAIRGGDFRGKSCVVPAESLAAPFGEGIAPCLARLACGVGLRSRRNADRLTALLEGAMRRAGTLGPYEERWTVAAADPSREGVDPRDCTDNEVNDDSRRPTVAVIALAPPGFPPMRALQARVKALCEARRVGHYFLQRPVSGPRDAFAEYARGLPSLWIGATEIDPPRGRQPAYEVRTFPVGDGRALLPSDEALAAAIEIEAERSRRGRPGTPYLRERKRMNQGKVALARWLAVHAPDEYCALIESEAIEAASEAASETASGKLPLPILTLGKAMTKRRLPALLAEDEGEDDGEEHDIVWAACTALHRSHQRIAALLAAFEAAEPGLTRLDPAAEMALAALLRRAEQAIQGGAAEDAALAEAEAAASSVMEICRALDLAPLDASCARACVEEALARFWEVTAGGKEGGALAAARERFGDAVELAIRRHEERDADGNPPSCFELRAALAALYGRPPPGGAKKDSSAVAAAVTAAWEAAVAAGLGEIEAAARCLSAATEAAENQAPEISPRNS
jgi:hypothetical protein